jgi:DinB superfamily
MAGDAPELQVLDGQLGAIHGDAQALVSGLGEKRGAWRENPASWSVAQCLDHLAIANRVYLSAMQPAALIAREHGRRRRGPALPGMIGRLFIRTLEPPVKRIWQTNAPHTIRPAEAPPLSEALAKFVAAQDEVLAFLRGNSDLDLASIRFPNPFIPGVRFSLATGLHVIAAHDRRHLWQAWRVRRAAEKALSVA